MKDLVTQHYENNAESLIKYMAFRRYGNVMDGEDIVHEAYLRAVTYFYAFDPEKESFDKWFNGILKNAYRDFQKKERKYGMSEELEEEMLEPVTHNLEHYQDIHGVRKLIGRQVAHHIDCLTLYYVYQYQLKDIADLLTKGYKWVDNVIKEFRIRAMREKRL